MIVIADTGPLNYLVLIRSLEVLPKLYERVVVPPSVFTELTRSGAPTPVRDWIATQPAWLEMRVPTYPLDRALVQARLGPGETEAIALAQEIHADELILDD